MVTSLHSASHPGASMKRILASALAWLALACGETAAPKESRLQLVVPSSGIEMATEETRTIQLLVLGAGGEPVELSGELPPFASLAGSLLVLAPSRVDVGGHEVLLVATAGAQVASATLFVNVTRANTAPAWASGGVHMADDAGIYSPFACNLTDPGATDCCPGPACVLGISPAVALVVCDAELDAVTIEVEVVPLAQPFTGVPTHSVTRRPEPADSYGGCFGRAGDSRVPLEGLLPATSYAFSVRTRDEWGATTPSNVESGWRQERYLQFTYRP